MTKIYHTIHFPYIYDTFKYNEFIKFLRRNRIHCEKLSYGNGISLSSQKCINLILLAYSNIQYYNDTAFTNGHIVRNYKFEYEL